MQSSESSSVNIVNSIAWTILRWCPGQEFMILDMLTNNNSKFLKLNTLYLGVVINHSTGNKHKSSVPGCFKEI